MFYFILIPFLHYLNNKFRLIFSQETSSDSLMVKSIDFIIFCNSDISKSHSFHQGISTNPPDIQIKPHLRVTLSISTKSNLSTL